MSTTDEPTDDERLDAAWRVLWRRTSGHEGDPDADDAWPAASALGAWVDTTFVHDARAAFFAQGGMTWDSDVVQSIFALRMARAEEMLAWRALVEGGLGAEAAWTEVQARRRHPQTDPSPLSRGMRPGIDSARASRIGISEFEELVLCPLPDVYRFKGLATAGMPPNDVSARVWRPQDGVLPNGQWIPEGWVRRVLGAMTESVSLAHGLTIPRSDALRLAEMARERKIDAIRELRGVTGCGLKEAKEAIESLLADGVRSACPSPRSRRRPAGRSAARDWLGTNVDGLLADYPLHWVILAAATIIEDASLPTMAVGVDARGQLLLFYNPTFTLSLSPEHCRGVLMHEINHVIFGHLDRPADVFPGDAWTVACECTANEFVRYELPGDPVRLEMYGLPPHESTLTRYKKLQERLGPGLTRPRCSGVLGDWLVPGATRHDDTADRARPVRTTILRDAAALVGDEIDEGTLQALAINHADSPWVRALRPEGLAQLPWRGLIAQIPSALRVREASRRVPSRRAPDLVGVIPGRRRTPSRPRVLVAIDTSGSMGSAELQQVAAELRGLADKGVDVTCVHCDTVIRATHRVGPGFVLEALHGGGGTDLRPPFSVDVLRKHTPAQIIYFTDGHGQAPAAAPVGVSVLWILTGHRPRVPAPFGRVATLCPSDQRQRVER